MSQYDFGNLSSPLTGSALINTHLEPWRDALHSLHSGTVRPSYAVNGTLWLDTSANPRLLKFFDGSADITIGRIDTTADTHTVNGDIQSAGSAGVIIRNSAGTAVATIGPSAGTLSTFAGQVNISGVLQANGKVTIPDVSELTIASGVVTVTGTNHTIDTEADASSDNLDTINGALDGMILTIRAENTARTVVLTNAGNIVTPDGQSIHLDSTSKPVVLQYDTALSKWVVLSAPIYSGSATSGQTLIADGVGGASWGAVSSGLVPIAASTVSGATSVDFINGVGGVVFNSTYKGYMVKYNGTIGTDNKQLQLQTTTNSGSSWDSGASDYDTIGPSMISNSGTVSGEFGASTSISLTGYEGIGSASGENFSGTIIINNPSVAQQCLIHIETDFIESSGFLRTFSGSGRRNAVADVDGIRFMGESGSTITGTFILYGMKGV